MDDLTVGHDSFGTTYTLCPDEPDSIKAELLSGETAFLPPMFAARHLEMLADAAGTFKETARLRELAQEIRDAFPAPIAVLA